MYRVRTCRAPTCTGRQLNPFFLKNHPKTAIFGWTSPNEFKISFFALSIIGSCPKLLGEHVQKIWPHELWDNCVWSGKQNSFPLCPVGSAGFYRLWGHFFEPCKLHSLHHLNAYYVRYLYTKFYTEGMKWTYSNARALMKGTKFSITLAILAEFYLEYISLELV
jgi:hypothetical protein